MSLQNIAKPTNVPDIIAGRYRVEQMLGQGGMGVVYRVFDAYTENYVALKLISLHSNDAKQAERLARFEREYFTLVHLAHPRIIDVYDYGVDSGRAYYTMEFLDGGDLRDRAPMGWKRACALLRDVASALAIVHSRHMVHRDLSPRNIRYTAQGLAKLFDFGALAPMGPCKRVVGTPPYTAPEVINHQTLDARADLYSLGATAYYVLTGRNAYPARTFAQLRDIWRSRPIPPSRIVDGIPHVLDNLVMSLLSLDQVSRPSSAAELMERLSAIADIDHTEEPSVSRAYLATPTLVGRDEPLLQVRKRMIRALSGQGGVLLVQGTAGAGRSRFLDASILEGKLAGAAVLRADAGDAYTGDYGVARALVEQIWEKLPEIAIPSVRPHAGVIGHIMPELRERLGPIVLTAFRDRHEMRPRIQIELRTWLLELSRTRPIVVAVDDIDHIDEPSAAFLAALGHKAVSSNLVVIATAEIGAESSAPTSLKLLTEYAEPVVLRALSAEHIESLLRSVFGDIQNIQLVSSAIYSLCEGNPRTCMELARHMVDRGTARYEAGRWQLPNRLSEGDLPPSLWVAFEERVQMLSPDARELGDALAVSATDGLTTKDYLALTEHRDIARLYRALDELVAAQVLASDGNSYRFAQQGWPALFLRQLTPERRQKLHRLSGEVFESNGRDWLRAAHHLIAAGDQARGVAVLIDGLKVTWKGLDTGSENMDDFLHTKRPYFSTLITALSLCDSLGRRKRDHYLLLNAVVLIGLYADRSTALSYIPPLFSLLYRESGLDIWDTLSEELSTEERLQKALRIAQQRYDNTPRHERVASPAAAILQLARLVVQVAGLASTIYDLPLFEAAPSLAPLVPLSPALGVAKDIADNVALAIGGRLQQARRGFLSLLERLESPVEGVGDQLVDQYVRLGALHALARIEAEMGLDSALMRAEALDANPLHQVNGWWARMTYYLCFGDKTQAELCRVRAELLQIQNSPLEIFEGVVLTNQLLSYARAEDLMGVKQVTDNISVMAKAYKGWEPYLHVGLGENHRIRGDHERALAEFERALSLTAPGRHLAWQWAAGSRLRVLEQLGRCEEAESLAQEALQACKDAGIQAGYDISDIIHALALAEARLGRFDTAVRKIEALIESYREQGVAGLPLGLAYETRARIAIWMKDLTNFRIYSDLIVSLPGCGRSITLTTRYQRLIAEGAQAQMGVTSFYPGLNDGLDPQAINIRSLLGEIVAYCPDPTERARRTFELLVEQSGALGGYLFLLLQSGPRLVMCHGDVAGTKNLDQMVRQYLRLEGPSSSYDPESYSDTDSKDEEDKDDWIGEDGARYRPLLLGIRKEGQFVVIGLVALQVGPTKNPRVFWDVVGALSSALLEAGERVVESIPVSTH